LQQLHLHDGRIRDLLVSCGLDAGTAHLALFSRDGFTRALIDTAARRDHVHLISLDDLHAE